jgi:hypothetical protein
MVADFFYGSLFAFGWRLYDSCALDAIVQMSGDFSNFFLFGNFFVLFRLFFFNHWFFIFFLLGRLCWLSCLPKSKV